MSDFVHLHVHSEFSLLDGLAKLPALVARAKELGMRALAITDHGNLYGAIEFYSQAIEQGIKPIIGCEVYVAPASRHSRQSKSESSPHHLVLLAKDDVGYHNLIRLCTQAHLEGFYYKPRIDRELLSQHGAGLVATSACPSGEIPRLILQGDHEGAERAASWYAELFGRDGFYLELQSHSLPEFQIVNPALVALAKKLDIPLVATNDVHYISQDDAKAQEILLCIQTNTALSDPKRMRMRADTFYLRSPDEMSALFQEHPEALSNTLAIAEQCDLKFEFGRIHLPEFPLPSGYNPDSYLEKLCRDGLRRRYERIAVDVDERLRYELDVIKETRFALYILIVADIVRYARDNGILFGPRGSAAGSIVCYCLGISDIDPVANDLVFERFLNIERREMPDIDMDFADERRDEVINYCAEKYGRDHVAQIITFGTLGAKAAIRDVGRAMGLSYAAVDSVAKLVPSLPPSLTDSKPITLEKAIQESSELRHLCQADEQIKELIESARAVEGVARHASTHAAGVVISHDPLSHHVPLQRASKQNNGVMTQYPMNALAKIGLIKMDFLGLANLTILDLAVQLVKRTRGLSIDLQTLPLDDEKVFVMLGRGATTGIFQLESVGMRRYIQELKPRTVHDLAAMVALFRPGPMAHISEFIRARAGLEPISYIHPSLEPILAKTYGVIVYQEQVMQIVQAVAGYTLGQADLFRKAMGKKQMDVMSQQRDIFIEGAAANEYKRSEAGQIFDLIKPFAGYAFNRAHAYCYAMVAYKTAYMKANFPEEYMVAVLTSAQDNSEKVSIAAAECRRMRVDLLPPDINRSELQFSIETNGNRRSIRFGLGAIKNVGVSAAQSVVDERRQNGAFRSVEEFCRRVDPRAVNKRVLDSLIRAGALSGLGGRAQMLESLDQMLSIGQMSQKASQSGQASLFELVADHHDVALLSLPDVPEPPLKELLAWEKELLGTYASEHPMEAVIANSEEGDFVGCDQIAEELAGQSVELVAMVTGLRPLTTKKGDEMLTVTVEDILGTAQVVVFPRTLASTRDVWVTDSILVIRGKVDGRDGRWQLVCDTARPYVASSGGRKARSSHSKTRDSSASSGAANPSTSNETTPVAVPPPEQDRESDPARMLRLRMTRSGDERHDLRILDELFGLLDTHSGQQKVILSIASADDTEVQMVMPQTVALGSRLSSDLVDLLGTGCVEIQTDGVGEPSQRS